MEFNSFNAAEFFKEPITADFTQRLLGHTENRETFLHDYPFFLDDDNLELYTAWLQKNHDLKAGVSAEHVYSLAQKADIFMPELITLAERVLKGRYRAISKLFCLDYLIYQKEHLSIDTLANLSLIAIKHSYQYLIQLQGNLNLCLSKAHRSKAIKEIDKILSETGHTHTFSRTVNNFHHFDAETRALLGAVVKRTIEDWPAEGVKEDILSQL